MDANEIPKTIPATVRLSVLQWLAVVVCGGLSVLTVVAIISNILIFLNLPRWPNALWQWIGISVMMFAMLLFGFGMGWTAWGVLFQNRSRRRIGMYCCAASIACYILCVAFAVAMRNLYPGTFPFSR